MKSEWQLFTEAWEFIVFILAGAFGLLIGRERQRWRVDQIGQKLDEVEREMRDEFRRIKAREHDDEKGKQHVAVLLVRLETKQSAIFDTLVEMRKELKGKVDK